MDQQPTPAETVRVVASRHGGLAGLARKLNLSGGKGTVWAWLDRDNVPPEHAAAIEQLEGGVVSVEQLTRGVRWRRIPNAAWPHPDGEPLIAVSREPAANDTPSAEAA